MNSQCCKILCTIGTRPEAIKMAPVIAALRREPWAQPLVLATAQHRQLLDDVLRLFAIQPEFDLNIMRPGQRLSELTARLLTGLDEVLSTERPDLILAQGDTTTVLATALAAFYAGIPFGHVEAGLRTGQLRSPFPEEANRRLAAQLAAFHFAPTEQARANLLAEGIAPQTITVTGNTAIDALHAVRDQCRPLPFDLPAGHRLVLLTAHRRENFGAPLEAICAAARELADRFPDLLIVYPVHPNPNIRPVAERLLGGHPRVRLIAPLGYGDFVAAMFAATLILTDSGGIQEEAPALGKPVLVLRRDTERPEGIACGVVKLVGTERAAIVDAAERLLRDPAAYRAMASGASPYGDGQAAGRIIRTLAAHFAR